MQSCYEKPVELCNNVTKQELYVYNYCNNRKEHTKNKKKIKIKKTIFCWNNSCVGGLCVLLLKANVSTCTHERKVYVCFSYFDEAVLASAKHNGPVYMCGCIQYISGYNICNTTGLCS